MFTEYLTRNMRSRYALFFQATGLAQAQIDEFVEALENFAIGWSWGGAHSLAMPYNVKSMRTAAAWPHDGVLVRLYVGLEDEVDLRADLEQAMSVLGQ